MESVPVTMAEALEGDAGGLRTSPRRSDSPFLVIGDNRPFWEVETVHNRTGKTITVV